MFVATSSYKALWGLMLFYSALYSSIGFVMGLGYSGFRGVGAMEMPVLGISARRNYGI